MSLIKIIAGPLFELIDKAIPDPEAKAKLKYDVLELEQKGVFKEIEAKLELARQQNEVNLQEAKSESLFKSGWRPAVGWTCVLGLIYTYLFQPLLSWFATAKGINVPPQLDLGDLLTLLFGMLGLGVLRTYEKKQGVS